MPPFPRPTRTDHAEYLVRKDAMPYDQQDTARYGERVIACLDIAIETGAEPLTIAFRSTEARWDGDRWNGFPAIKLPAWQAYLLALLMDEPAGPVPTTNPDEEASQSARYVYADGLCWELEEEGIRTWGAGFEEPPCPECQRSHGPRYRGRCDH